MTAIQRPGISSVPTSGRLLPRAAEIATIALLLLTLRLPSLFEPHHYGDEGVFAATAQQMLSGDTLYRDIWDNKPPLVFVVYTAVITVAGPSMTALHLVGVAWSAATALVVLAIGRRIGGETAGWLAALLYAVVASLPAVEGTLLLTEHLMALPAALAMLVALHAADERGRQRDRLIAAVGVALGIACLFKQVAVFDAAAVGLWLLCRRERPLRDAAILIAGWFVPVAAAALWLVSAGALAAAWEALIGTYGAYLGEGSALPVGFQVFRFCPAAVAMGWLLLQRRRGTVGAGDLALLWLGFAVLGATMGGRPFGHYLMQVLAPLVVVLANLTPRPPSLARKGESSAASVDRESSLPPAEIQAASVDQVAPFRAREGGRGVSSVVLALAVITLIAGFRGYWLSHPTLTPDYYGNWLAWVTGNRTREEYDRSFSWRVGNQRELMRLIEAEEGERSLYVWGEYPWLYALLDAENPAPYTTAYQTTIVPGSKEAVMEALAERPPHFIVHEIEEWRRLPGLAEFLSARYERVAQVDNTVLWHRIER